MTDIKLTKEAKNVIKLCEKQRRNVFMHGAGGTGKCLSGDTLISLYYGEAKTARDIVPFDVLRGDDGYPRYVTDISAGLDAMYRVWYTSPLGVRIHFDCNSIHILTIHSSSTNVTIDVSLDRYLAHADTLYSEYRGVVFDFNTKQLLKLYSIDVEKISEMAEYFGFTLTHYGDDISSNSNSGRFVLANGIVTHNTHTIRQVADYLEDQYVVARCATTGIASINLHTSKGTAKTLHSWAGIGLGKGTAKKLALNVMMKAATRKRWEDTDYLIIEEISMMGADLLNKLDYIGRKVRNRLDTPFGGITIIVLGDFLQLPPINAEWVFLSSVWSTLNFSVVIFDKSRRYSDGVYFSLLQRARKGEITDTDSRLLRRRMRAYERLLMRINTAEEKGKMTIKPTVIFTTNARVDGYNKEKLMVLNTPSFFYEAEDTYASKDGGRVSYKILEEIYHPRLDEMIADRIELKVGAQVMLKWNFDTESGLCNGSRGVVVNLAPSAVIVAFLNGEKRAIEPVMWKYESNGVTATRCQMPIVLAWACTVHKSQGMTVDYAVMDIGSSIFCGGQAYVALSRVRSLKGLFLSGYKRSSIYAEQTALEFVKTIEK